MFCEVNSCIVKKFIKFSFKSFFISMIKCILIFFLDRNTLSNSLYITSSSKVFDKMYIKIQNLYNLLCSCFLIFKYTCSKH